MRRGASYKVAAAVVVGALCIVAVAEVTLRVTSSGFHLRQHDHIVADPVFHHRMLPNATATIRGVTFTTNSRGFKDDEIQVPKPKSVFRILMLGDGFTEGPGLSIDETPAKALEWLLNHGTACTGRYEVVNAGTASYSPILEYLQLKHVGLGLQPDLVVLNFDMSDVHDDWIRTRAATLDDRGLPIAVPHKATQERGDTMLPMMKPTWLGFLTPPERVLSQSAIYQAVRRSRPIQRLAGSARICPGQLKALGLMGDIQYDPMAITRDAEPRGLREAWALTDRYLDGIASLTAEHHVGFILVVYPYPHQVSATASPGGRLRLDLALNHLYASERPFDLVEDFGRRRGVPVINLRSLFRDEVRAGARVFLRDNEHLTPEGARVLARGIFEGLSKREILPPCRRSSSSTRRHKPVARQAR